MNDKRNAIFQSDKQDSYNLKQNLSSRISRLVKQAEDKKDTKRLDTLHRLKRIISVNSISLKIEDSVKTSLSEIEAAYDYNAGKLLLVTNDLIARATKLTYASVVSDLKKLQDHITGEFVMKNKTPADIEAKIKSLEEDIKLMENREENFNKPTITPDGKSR